MNTQVYIGVLVFLFILLLVGWSKNLFWFVVGGVIGVVGLRMYDSELLERLSHPTDIVDEVNVAGVWSPHKTVLIDLGREKQLVIPNTQVPRDKITECSTEIYRMFINSLYQNGVQMEVVLCPKIKSKKGMLYGPDQKPLDYYLELHPNYTKRGENGSIAGYYALRKDIDEKRLEDPQKKEIHSQLLELLKLLINDIFKGKLPEGVALLAASRTDSSIPDVGVLSLFGNVGKNLVTPAVHFYQMQDSDMVHSEGEQRGIVNVKWDDEIIKMPVIGKKSPDVSKVKNMPFLRKIEELADQNKLVLVLQDYITTGFVDGKQLPKNVVYVGQAVRAFDEKKVFLNAFINPICYDYVIRALTKILG